VFELSTAKPNDFLLTTGLVSELWCFLILIYYNLNVYYWSTTT